MYILKPLSKLVLSYYILYQTMNEVKVNRNMHFFNIVI